MTIAFAQGDRPLQAKTPLGRDVLIPIDLTGREAISEPFRFTVEFAAALDASVALKDVLGKGVTISLDGANGTTRFFHGIVHRFGEAGANDLAKFYRAELVPAFALLRHGADCRTFENKSILDIVKTVLSEGGVSELAVRVQAEPPKLPFLVQYRESNFDFVSRLLESAGLFYAFEHADGKHMMVISDAKGDALPACASANVKQRDQLDNDDVPMIDTVARLRREVAMHTKSVSILDHDLWRTDSQGSIDSSNTWSVLGERFDFLGDLGPNASSDEAKVLIEQSEAGRETVRGRSGCRFLEAGRRVTIDDTNGPLTVPTAMLVTEVTHAFGQSGLYGGSSPNEQIYRSDFAAIPAPTPWRPLRRTPVPRVRGTQVAKVVGSGGDANIDVDEHGAVLLEFPWDRGDGKGGKSKHRVFVASVWAGQKWGFVQHPRIGQEVLVEFLEGDVDRPIVTGRVYNSKHPYPYDLPDNRSQSGWKSRSVPNGGDDNFNELRFEDKKGEEHVYLQAEKDLEVYVKNDEFHQVLRDRNTEIKRHDTRSVLDGNDTHTIKKGNQTVEVSEGNQEVTVKQGDQTIKVETGKQTITVKDDQTLTVDSGNRKTQVKMGNDDLIVDMGNMSIQVKMGNISTKVDLGKVETEAMQSIELKVGQSSIKLDQMGVTIKGMNVKVEAMMQAEMKGMMTKVEGNVMLQAKSGAMAQIDGGGMLMAKGALTMIG